MKLSRWKLALGLTLLGLSAVFYLGHYFLFHDAHHIFIYLVGDVAFVFVEVLLVTLIIHHLLNEWEKQSKLKKLNMVIETFFSEFAKHLLVYLSNADRQLPSVRNALVLDDCEGEPDFRQALKTVRGYQGNIDMGQINLAKLEAFLRGKRSFLVGLLQNPSLLEHESFTESLMAVFHITEELAARDLDHLSPEDLQHTKEDLERAYALLIRQWLSYMEHIRKHYPYFFLFAMNTNPFDASASWIDRWSERVQDTSGTGA